MTTNSDVLIYDTSDSVNLPKQKPKILKLVAETDAILKEVMPDFNFADKSINAVELAESLVESCKLYKGYGLSANQCGIRARVFVMGAGDEYVAFFNPKLLSSTGEIHLEEGCLSFPLLGLRITRPKDIEVEYQDYTGTTKYMRLNGISARVFLHELDHMNGIVYTDRTKPLALASGQKKRQKLFKNILNNGKKVQEAYTYS
jgi:peptide deformylase